MSTDHGTVVERSVGELAEVIVDNVALALRGKREVVELALLAWLAEGHVLIEDVPGTGKTTLGRAMAASLHAEFSRVQFTPDLLPSDVTGGAIFDARISEFVFRPGPAFANVLLADEINRASPKVQSSLLEVMAERQVTTDGTSRPVPRPFIVLATQNSSDSDGTYPLPQAQLDRFALQLSIGYPHREAALAMLLAETAIDTLPAVVSVDEMQAAVEAVKTVYVSPELGGYLLDLVDATRTDPEIALGASPRAAQTWLALAKARAAVAGRDHVLPDDVLALALPTLRHRVVPAQSARVRGASVTELIADILRRVSVPQHRALRAV